MELDSNKCCERRYAVGQQLLYVGLIDMHSRRNAYRHLYDGHNIGQQPIKKQEFIAQWGRNTFFYSYFKGLRLKGKFDENKHLQGNKTVDACIDKQNLKTQFSHRLLQILQKRIKPNMCLSQLTRRFLNPTNRYFEIVNLIIRHWAIGNYDRPQKFRKGIEPKLLLLQKLAKPRHLFHR